MPIFNKIAANKIEPFVEASTWAFGSQKWSIYTGLLAKNIRKRKIQEKYDKLKFLNFKNKTATFKFLSKIIKLGKEKKKE